MKLKVLPRATEKKRDSKRARREGKIPAVLYTRGKQGETISLDTAEFLSHLRSIPKGRLSTSVFALTDEKGKERKALVKDIQYHTTTYDILHLDFEELVPDVTVNVKVPIEITGAVDCAGVKLGGTLRTVIRTLKVNCLPKNIPDYFEVDVKDLGIKQYRKLKDLKIPEGVKPLADLEEVAVVVAKR